MTVDIPRKARFKMVLGRWFTVAATACLLIPGGVGRSAGFGGGVAGCRAIGLRRGVRHHRAALAVRPLERCALARDDRLGKAARRYAVADRARWQRCGHLVGPPWRRALFMVHRGRGAGRRFLARDAGSGRMRPDHPRDRREREETQSRAGVGGLHLAGARQLEQHNGRLVRGLDREAVRRAARPGSVVEGVERSAARPVA